MLSTGRKCSPHKAEDTYTATRARGGGAPEGAPPTAGRAHGEAIRGNERRKCVWLKIGEKQKFQQK